MKRIIVTFATVLLLAGSVASASPSPRDQKWLETVQKMVEKGHTRIVTPSKERLDLLKGWASKQGLSVQVTRTDTGYKIEVARSLVKD